MVMAPGSPSPMLIGGRVICTVFDGLSLVSCVWLLCKLRRLPEAQRRRLFPRQVLVLAASDVCCVLPWSYGFRCFLEPDDDQNRWDLVWNIGRCWTLHATLLAELNIVLGFGAQIFASPRASRCLSSCLWLPWLLATILTPIEMAIGGPHLKWGAPASIFECLCFLVALLTFVAVLCRARTSNTAVARRSWRRAASYVATFVVTFAPILCLAFKTMPDSAEMGLFAFAPFHLNGFLNALMYFAQSRYLRTTHRKSPPMHEEGHAPLSLVVRFEDIAADDLACEPVEEKA